MNSFVKSIQEELIENKNFPSFKAGDTITAYYEIREGEKVRTQFFKGIVIQVKGQGLNKTFTHLPKLRERYIIEDNPRIMYMFVYTSLVINNISNLLQ